MNQIVKSMKPSKSMIVRGSMIVVAIVALAIGLPLVYLAFLSTLGLLGIAITAAIGFAFIQSLPYLGQKLENKLLGLRKKEARENPIEQIENNVIRKSQQLKAFRDGLELIGGQIGSLSSSLKNQKQHDPTEDFSDQEEAIEKMQLYYQIKKNSYAEAMQALQDYKKAVDRAKFKFGFGTAAAGIAQAMNASDAETLMQNMLSDESFKAVDLKFNTAFATLDMDTLELNANKQIEFGKGVKLDFNNVHIPTNIELLERVK